MSAQIAPEAPSAPTAPCGSEAEPKAEVGPPPLAEANKAEELDPPRRPPPHGFESGDPPELPPKPTKPECFGGPLVAQGCGPPVLSSPVDLAPAQPLPESFQGLPSFALALPAEENTRDPGNGRFGMAAWRLDG